MEKIDIQTSKSLNVRGTSKRGTLGASYSQIVGRFGKPTNKEPNNDTYNEWRIRFEVPAEDDPTETDYVIATIYDWGEEDDPALEADRRITFNIGGFSVDAPYYVHQVLGQ